jgi:hypothetical protein
MKKLSVAIKRHSGTGGATKSVDYDFKRTS